MNGEKREFETPKGVKKQILGAVLFMLGGLDVVFAVRAGFEIDKFYVFLLISGACLFLYGTIQRGQS